MPDPQPHDSTQSWFARFATGTARASGHPIAFGLACASLVVWALTGPIVQFGDSWQLTINTVTTIITFLMVFVIQNSQNRDTEALQVKIDELIRATKGAHNALLDLEELGEDQLRELRAKYMELAAQAREQIARGESDVGSPQIKKPL